MRSHREDVPQPLNAPCRAAGSHIHRRLRRRHHGAADASPRSPAAHHRHGVSPATAELTALGATVQLSAEVQDQNGQVMAGTTVTWASSAPAVATVGASGLVSAVANGAATVTATAGAATGAAAVTVAQEVASVAVSPAEATVTALGDTVRLGAEALDGNGNPVAGAEVGWSSSDTSVAVVDASGLVTAVANGAATVTATAGAATGAAAVTVAQEASVVAVSPPAATVSIGSTVQLLAEAFDANEHLVEGAYFGWSSSNTSVVAVDPSGLVTGISEGRATVTAAAGDARGTAEITVENPDRAALVALYRTTGGANWINSENWLSDAPLGQWYGVTTAQGRVVGLDLSGYRDFEARETVLHGLAGPIPPELGSLTKLRALQLLFNELSGPIPPELGNLTDLESLILDTNYLSGSIPPELGRLANLRHLGLRNNFLTGRIPPELSNLFKPGAVDTRQ